jgi:general secretion pathway protein D
MGSRKHLPSLMAAVALAGCQAEPPAGPAGSLPLPAAAAQESRVSGSIADGRSPGQSAVLDYGHGGQPAVPASGPAEGDQVTLNFPEMDIREVVATVIGKILKAPYTIDSSVAGTVNLVTPTPIPRDRILPMLQLVFAQRGVTIVESNGLYQILPLTVTTNRPLLGGIEPEGGAEVVPLRYTSAGDIAKLMQPFVAHGAKLSADPGHNAIVVVGDQLTRATLIELVRALDTDLLAGQSYALFPVTSGTPEKVADELQKALVGGKDSPLAGALRIIPMPRIDAVLVVGAQPGYVDQARRLMRLVDKASESSEPGWHIYYVRNGQSADLEYLLQRAFTPEHVTATGSSDTNRLGVGTAAAKSGGQGGSDGGNAAGPLAGAAVASLPAPPVVDTGGEGQRGQAQPAAALQALSPVEGEGGEEAANRIRIVANMRNNALLIYASPDQYKVIEAMVQKIDLVPLQVRIDATILEVTLNDALKYGTQFFFKHGALTGELGSPTATGTIQPSGLKATDLISSAPDFLLNTGTRGFDVAVDALRSVTDVRVLSSPQVSVLDNELATIQVGDEVPLTTQSQQSTLSAGAPLVNSISYRQTGVILQVIPRVNSSGLVALDLSQVISDPESTVTSSIDSPTFQNRTIQSRIVVQDGQTFGVAGLIRDSKSVGNSGVPYLKDVPILGSLFSEQKNTRTRTELLVLLTPHVIYDQRDARMLTDDLRNAYREAGRVPEVLQSTPPASMANPNGGLAR